MSKVEEKYLQVSKCSSRTHSISKQELIFWPEWNESTLANEKFDNLVDVQPIKHNKPGKEKNKELPREAVPPSGQETSGFEDPEGNDFLPPSMKVAKWVRPHEYLADKMPVVVDDDGLDYFDLVTCSQAANEFEIMRLITSQIAGLLRVLKVGGESEPDSVPEARASKEPIKAGKGARGSSKNKSNNSNNNNSNDRDDDGGDNRNSSNDFVKKAVGGSLTSKGLGIVVEEEDEEEGKKPVADVNVVAKDVRHGSVNDNVSNNVNNNVNTSSNNKKKKPGPKGSVAIPEAPRLADSSWRPWDHVYSSAGGGRPAYNPCGKYCVRLHWMGCWRKLVVDDLMPLDECGRLMLPQTRLCQEIWPTLLTKALMKIIALDARTNADQWEPGDSSIVQCLTGWSPEVVPLRDNPHSEAVWRALRDSLDEFKLPGLEGPPRGEAAPPPVDSKEKQAKEETQAKKGKEAKGKRAQRSSASSTRKGKASKLSERTPSESGESKEEEEEEEAKARKKPELLVVCTFVGKRRYGSKEEEEATAESIKNSLGCYGLEPERSHALVVTQTRSVPLEVPIEPEPVPRWKMIRPMNSEEPKPEKPIRCLKVVSAFVDNTQNLIEDEWKKICSQVQKSISEVVKDVSPSPSPAVKTSSGMKKQTKSGGPSRSTHSVKEEAKAEPQVRHETSSEFWIDLDDFFCLFGQLMLFHKVETYPCVAKECDLDVPNATEVSTVDRTRIPPRFIYLDTSESTELVVSFSCISRWKSPPGEVPSSAEIPANHSASDQAPQEESKVVKTLRHMCNKGEVPPPPPELPPTVDCPANEVEDRNADGPEPGRLNLYEWSWRENRPGCAVLRVCTTGSRSAAAILRPGRHVLRVECVPPIRFHYQVASRTDFLFLDEESILHELTKDSLSFRTYAIQSMSRLSTLFDCFGHSGKFGVATSDFLANVLGFNSGPGLSLRRQDESFKSALYASLRIHLRSSAASDSGLLLLTPEMNYALRVALFDPETPNPLEVSFVSPQLAEIRPGTSSERSTSVYGKKKKGSLLVSQQLAVEETDQQKTREFTECEHRAATVVQRHWRGHRVRKIIALRCMPRFSTRGLKQKRHYESVKRNAQLLSDLFRRSAEPLALEFYRRLLCSYPDWLGRFPFCWDERDKVVLADYEGEVGQQSTFGDSYNLVFRDAFAAVDAPKLCALRLLSTPPTSPHSRLPWLRLRVVDNDTRAEVPKRIGETTVASSYRVNDGGYTIMAESLPGHFEPGAAPPLKWRLKMIGSSFTGLLEKAEPKNDLLASFAVTELRHYYMPENGYMFSYDLSVLSDDLSTLSLTCSNPEVLVEMSVYDCDVLAQRSTGTGGAIMPAFTFRCNLPEVKVQAPGQGEDKEGEKEEDEKKTKEDETTGKDAQGKMDLSALSLCQPGLKKIPLIIKQVEDSAKVHRYRLEAKVVNGSWGLNKSQWDFVLSLKDERDFVDPSSDINGNTNANVGNDNANNSASGKSSKAKPEQSGQGENQSKQKPGKNKAKIDFNKETVQGAKSQGVKENEKGVKDNEKEVKVEFDRSRPHWVLRIFRDADRSKDSLKLVKTLKPEEVLVRSMMNCWEKDNPGRAGMAAMTRQTYLYKHLVKRSKSNVTRCPTPTTNLGDVTSEPYDPNSGEEVYTMEPPRSTEEPELYVPKMDLSMFKRRSQPHTKVLTDEDAFRLTGDSCRQVEEFVQMEKEMLEWLEVEAKKRLVTNECALAQYKGMMECGEQKLQEYLKRREEHIQRKLQEAEKLRESVQQPAKSDSQAKNRDKASKVKKKKSIEQKPKK